jgi:hypothetical protein
MAKTTLRLPAVSAADLARRARAADVSQGDYVAGLLAGLPPHTLAPNHAEAIAALSRSTDHLAAVSTDLSMMVRLMEPMNARRDEHYLVGLRLLEDVRQHLAVAASLVAELRPARRSR